MRINQSKCIRCYKCVQVYPDAFKMNNGRVIISPLFYKRSMVKVCPVGAIN